MNKGKKWVGNINEHLVVGIEKKAKNTKFA